uniref:NADH-ubiquinone oxidoreductase chain 6 n=1 Tax=Scarturus williamsi TaxID=2926630 RepID=A0A7D3UMW8_9RODE|nr:NADH dehydrogenase subunit 6 [Scarturus williamsi]QKE47121.1 NADH dehydrogenase subunit 6 [Scarturus williamsi]
MTMSVFLLSLFFVASFIGFATKPSPIYGGLGLILAGGLGCGLILESGGSYLGLMVFLVYLGGMMVVFGYTTAMATEDYPETWVSSWVVVFMFGAGLFVELVLFLWFMGSEEVKLIVGFDSMGDWVVMEGDQGGYMGEDMVGVSAIYDYGWWLVAVAGWTLFVSVFIVIEITRGG